ncbi:lipopolysaccharide biosynthesis domain protein [Bordetella holmesii 41130]|nr:lipopolysaccharide biosynthesis domain protein [Bordetella holmesii 41130]
MILPYPVRRLFVDLPRAVKQLLAIVLDAVILLFAFHCALWLRFELFFVTQQYFFLSLLACAGGSLPWAPSASISTSCAT